MIKDLTWGLIGVAVILFGAAVILMLAPAQVYAAVRCPGGQMLASHYGAESCLHHPCATADGTPFDGRQMVAASRTLPFGTRLRVTLGDRSVVVRIADRGPAVWTGRDLDLSTAAAERLHMVGVGVACVSVERLS